MNATYAYGRTVLALLCMTSLAQSQGEDHADVFFVYGGTRIEVQPHAGSLVIPADFPSTGIFRQASSDPGFVSETDVGAGTGPEDIIVYNILDDLVFWGDGDFLEPAEGTQIRILNNPSDVPDTVVTASSGPQPGSFAPPRNAIGQSNATGDFHAHVDFRLEPVSPDPAETPAFGAYGLKLSLSSDNPTVGESEPFFVVYRYGIDEDYFLDALVDFERLLQIPPSRPGDFDGDGFLTPSDIDLLSQEVRAGGHSGVFDLDGDNLVTQSDRTFWVQDLAGTFFGDADLNQAVEFADFLALSGGFGQPGGWVRGDFDGGGIVGFPDFLQLSSNFGKRVDVVLGAAVPEPGAASLALLSFGLACVGLRRGVIGGGCRKGRWPRECLAQAGTDGRFKAQTAVSRHRRLF